jgi:uncharacterized protein YuzE
MGSKPHVTYSQQADAVYVCLSDATVVRTRALGDWRNADYGTDGSVIGVEFLGVGAGLDLSGVPKRDEIEQLLKGPVEELHLRVLV